MLFGYTIASSHASMLDAVFPVSRESKKTHSELSYQQLLFEQQGKCFPSVPAEFWSYYSRASSKVFPLILCHNAPTVSVSLSGRAILRVYNASMQDSEKPRDSAEPGSASCWKDVCSPSSFSAAPRRISSKPVLLSMLAIGQEK